MKTLLIALGLVAAGVAVSRLPRERRESLSRVVQTIMEHCP